jgi:hypothetical protein
MASSSSSARTALPERFFLQGPHKYHREPSGTPPGFLVGFFRKGSKRRRHDLEFGGPMEVSVNFDAIVLFHARRPFD